MTDKTKRPELPVDETAEDRAALANSASKATPVPLAGVPETPLPDVAGGALGPAVPSVDHYVTEASPNQATSGPAEKPPAATEAVSGT